MEGVGQRIKDLRTDKDKTQSKMAKEIGVTRKQVERWESESSEMMIGKLYDLCIKYSVSADYILELPKGLNWPR